MDSANRSQSGGQTSPQVTEAQAGTIIAGLALVATAKYLPIILVGVVFGFIVTAAARGEVGLHRFKTIVLGLLFFSIAMFILCGLPFTGQDPHNYGGAIIKFYWPVS